MWHVATHGGTTELIDTDPPGALGHLRGATTLSG